MKYHFKRMLQHNTFDTQWLLNICLKKYNLKNHKREKKIKENNMSIVTATKKNPCMVLIEIKCYFKTQSSHFLQSAIKKIKKKSDRFLTHIMTLSQWHQHVLHKKQRKNGGFAGEYSQILNN